MKVLGVLTAAAAFMFSFAWPASATAANVVPNPGFEQAGCGDSTPVLCNWQGDGAIAQDTTNPHSGSTSMHLDCGVPGVICFFDPDSTWEWTDAYSTVCVKVGPGAHAASFWYRDAVGGQVSLDATFYYDSSCINQVGQDSLVQQSPGGAGWHQVSGALHGPTYTQSALLSLSIAGACDPTSCPSLSASFDDVSVADVGDPTPAISSFTPTSGWFGTRVWIYGFDFTGATSVSFNGVPAQFSVQGDGFIDTNVPTGATAGPISVTTANGTGLSSSSFALVPPPVVSSFTPTDGVFGTVVDIRGSNFTGAQSVRFDNSYAQSFTVDSDSEIHATVPDGAKTGPISVTTVSGTGSSSSSFTVPTPTITSFTPTSGPPGTSVDILGTNLANTTGVAFDGVPASFTIDSDSEIHATVPTGARSGWIAVATNAGSAITTSSFSVVGGAPSVTSVTPLSGPIGTIVDLQGDNLTGTTSVTFGSIPTTFTVDSNTELHTTVPSGATNSYITVVTPLGSITEGALFLVTTSPPTISSFTPANGPVGTSVDIRGANFTGASTVTFNGTPATYTVDSDSELHATVPSAATSGSISVKTSVGSATTSVSFIVTPLPPTISTFSPTSGPVGTGVDIQGTNFTGATSVTFNGTSDTSFVVNSTTDITAHVPSGAATGPLSVTTPGGTATSSGSFTVTQPPPTITGFSPGSGHAGQQVTITGSNFTGATSVSLGTTPATFTVGTASSITAVVPSIARGYYAWSVTTPAGTGSAAVGSFHVR